MIKLRSDSHAQWEIQEYANAMYDLVKPKFPIICEAFEDYHKNGLKLSSNEAKLTKAMLGDFFDMWNDWITEWYDQKDTSSESVKKAEELLRKEFGLGKRELTEFKIKFEYI